MATVDTITVFGSSMNVAFFIGVSPRQVAVAHDGRSVRFKYQKVGSDEWRFMTVGVMAFMLLKVKSPDLAPEMSALSVPNSLKKILHLVCIRFEICQNAWRGRFAFERQIQADDNRNWLILSSKPNRRSNRSQATLHQFRVTHKPHGTEPFSAGIQSRP